MLDVVDMEELLRGDEEHVSGELVCVLLVYSCVNVSCFMFHVLALCCSCVV